MKLFIFADLFVFVCIRDINRVIELKPPIELDFSVIVPKLE